MTERCTTGRFVSIPLLSSGRAGRRHSITRKLGNMPDVALRAMRDYGLSDLDIARYYGLTLASVRRLSQLFSVAPGRPDSGCWIGRHKVARQAPSAAAQDRTYEADTNTRNDTCKSASIGEIASATEMNTAFRRIPQHRYPFIIPDDPTASERVGDVFADNGFLTEPSKRECHNCGDASEALAAFFQRQSGPGTVHAFDERDCHDHYTLEMPFLTAAKVRRMRVMLNDQRRLPFGLNPEPQFGSRNNMARSSAATPKHPGGAPDQSETAGAKKSRQPEQGPDEQAPAKQASKAHTTQTMGPQADAEREERCGVASAPPELHRAYSFADPEEQYRIMALDVTSKAAMSRATAGLTACRLSLKFFTSTVHAAGSAGKNMQLADHAIRSWGRQYYLRKPAGRQKRIGVLLGRDLQKPDTRSGQQRNGFRYADVRPMRRQETSPAEIMLLLPKLRFAARVMTGSAERGDHLVAQTLKRAIAEAARKPREIPLLDWLNGIMDDCLASRMYPGGDLWARRVH
ncbi:hypothetical protein [Fodinicurvata sp. EGI_FJ10296]|uniref:hypothetical protein n=1 Tax=Fodinicurvata sp. EGI_FJ10296 TaxID=3231908 RepID=UPI003455D0AC